MLIDETMDALSRRIARMEQAAAFPGPARERLIALAATEEHFWRQHAQRDLAQQSMLIAAQLGQAPAEVEDAARYAEHRLTNLLTDIVLEAIRQGDLPIRPGLGSAELAFTIWALAYGTRALMCTRVARQNLAIEDGLRVGRESLHLLLDGLGWRPLSSEWDYETTQQQVRTAPLAASGAVQANRSSVRSRVRHHSPMRLEARAEE